MGPDTKSGATSPEADSSQTPADHEATQNASASPSISFDEAFRSQLLEPVRQMLARFEQRLESSPPAVGEAPRGDATAGANSNEGVKTILSSLERIETQLANFHVEPTANTPPENADAAQTAPITAQELKAHRHRVKEYLEATGNMIIKFVHEKLGESQMQLARRVEQSAANSQAELAQLLESRFTKIDNTLAPEETEQQQAASDSAEWERAVLGEYLYEDAELVDQRHELIQGVLAGNESARAFAGQLLLVQAASKDDLTQHAKALGEAFYGWRPKTKDVNTPMEQALAAFLEKRFETVNLRNRIELVRPGDQYDRFRHHTDGRGVEITTVRGWIVLRENGKPSAKANVDVE